MEQIEIKTLKQEASDIIKSALDNPSKRKKLVPVPVGKNRTIYKIVGGYIVIPAPGATGEEYVPLEPGEALHAAYDDGKLYGYILQPPGGPTLKKTDVAAMLGCSTEWVTKLAKRGPLNEYPGFQPYKPSESHAGWEPKFYTRSDPGVRLTKLLMFYEKDILAWIEENAVPEEIIRARKEILRKIYENMEEKTKEFLRGLAEESKQANGGYVKRQNISKEAIARTRDLSEAELLATTGLKRGFSAGNRDYPLIQAIALAEDWPDNPSNTHHLIRRKPRVISQ